MDKMWAGRFCKTLDSRADDFNSSIRFDSRMFMQDICGSIAHAAMLEKQGILTEKECASLTGGLLSILNDLRSGALSLDPAAEDIHMFVEAELTQRLGDVGKKLHTARSRNDQVAVDLRLYLRDEAGEVQKLLYDLMESLLSQIKANTDTICPGYTHLQRAQPVTFAFHLLAYEMMFMRDVGRLCDAVHRMNVSPLGSCALSGTTYDTDRAFTAEKLDFDGICENSMDGVSDRDFCVELLSCFALIQAHLSRLCEELVLWSSWEFKFIELDDSFTTGSSIMPQKKNPDMAELIRGKTGRVFGDLLGMLTVLKGLPLAYNKDMQEDKEAIFDSLDTVKQCLLVASPMIATMKVQKKTMYSAAQRGFINATDLADYLVKKGLPFRTAYKLVGQIVAECIEKNLVLDTLPLEDYRKHSPLFESDLYEAISLETCVSKRISAGSTGPVAVQKQIELVTEFIHDKKNLY